MSLVVPFEEIFTEEAGLIGKHPTWQRVELGEVCDVVNGYPFRSDLFNREKGFPVVRIRDLFKGATETCYDGEVPEESIISNEDLLVGMDGIFRCYEWHGGKAGLNQRVCKLVPNSRFLLPKFLLFGINGYLKAIEDATSSVTVGHLSSLDVLRIPFPLPPLNEQHRIVAKLEKLLGKVGTCQQRLGKILVILKRFRQAVLAAACSGRLTAGWREENQAREVKEDPDLPIGWRYMSIKELLPPGGIFDGPFGSNLKTADYTDKGVRVVRLENISSLRFIHQKETYISQEKYKTLAKHTIRAGDLIFASFINEEVRACILPKLPTKAIAKADCFCLRPRQKVVDSHYLAFQLVNRESYERLSESVHGATRPRINTTQLRNLEVRLCPLAEQKEIVRRVNGLFALADQIEVRFTKAKSRVDQLTQSLLGKAFRGELVPQDPNDEAASVLLERIRAERTKGETEERAGGNRRKDRRKGNVQ
jgi:type I restriction enzyme, S subunit